MISEQGLIYIHKIQNTQTPTAISEMYNLNDKPKRATNTLRPKYSPKTKILKNSIFSKFTEIYSTLPDHLKIKEIKQFNKQIKDHISETFNPYSIPASNQESDSESDN